MSIPFTLSNVTMESAQNPCFLAKRLWKDSPHLSPENSLIEIKGQRRWARTLCRKSSSCRTVDSRHPLLPSFVLELIANSMPVKVLLFCSRKLEFPFWSARYLQEIHFSDQIRTCFSCSSEELNQKCGIEITAKVHQHLDRLSSNSSARLPINGGGAENIGFQGSIWQANRP